MEDKTEPKRMLPDVIDVDRLEAALERGGLTEAKMKFETPQSRQARETREAASAAHERLVTLLKLIYAGVLLFGFFALGVYLFAIKTDATEAQKLYASTVLTAIASGSAGYAFGKKENQSEKE